MSATVQDIMTTRVIAVRPEATFKDLAATLTRWRISAFPVIDEDRRVIGVVSEGDLLGYMAGPGSHLRHFGDLRYGHKLDWNDPDHLLARDLMTSPAVVIGSADPATEAARVMRDRRVRRLPVVGPSGHLVGIISRADVLSVYRRPDGDILREISRVLLDQFLIDPLSLHVSVGDGVVTLAGRPETDEVGQEIVAAIRHLEGVVAVRDRLHYASTARPARVAPAS